jgi:hypothetical protein
MEGSAGKTATAPPALVHQGRTIALGDLLRFAFGMVFIVMGLGLLLEAGVVSLGGHYLYLEGLNRAFEFYVGLMSLPLGGLLIAGMSKRSANP